jgi:hypothetical protein
MGPVETPRVAAPGAPIELPAPAVIKFVNYAGLKVDLSQISSTPTVQVTHAWMFPLSAPIDSFVTAPVDLSNRFINGFQKAIDGINQIEIPVNEENQACSMTVDFKSAGILNGPYVVNLDFTPFDFDNDGVPENCTGNTTQPSDFSKPICIRVWLGPNSSAVPFIAGLFDKPPIYLDQCQNSYCPTEAVTVGGQVTSQVACTCSQPVVDVLSALNVKVPVCSDDYCKTYPGTSCTCDPNLLSVPVYLGEGRFKLRAEGIPGFVEPDINESINILLQYTYTQDGVDSKKVDYQYKLEEYPASYDTSSLGPPPTVDCTNPPSGSLISECGYVHMLLSQHGPEESAFKGANMSINDALAGAKGKPQYWQYISQFVEGVPLWGGHVKLLSHTASELVSIEPPLDCAKREDDGHWYLQAEADRSVCADAGPRDESILVPGDMNFFGFLFESDFMESIAPDKPKPIAFPFAFGDVPTSLPNCDSYKP